MLKGLGDLAGMMRQAQHLGERMREVGVRLRGERVTAEAGAGLVSVEANGLGEVLRVRIDESLLVPGEQEVLEELVAAAVNQALTRSKQLHVEAIRSLTGGVELPGFHEAMESFVSGGNGKG
jgi:hypothetical protein